jgi:TRAP-type C4-dicarboxylate transport system permease small subunit
MLQASVTFIEVGMDADSMLFLQISQRMAAMILPVGFGLIMVQFLLRMIVNVVAGVHGPAPEEPAS